MAFVAINRDLDHRIQEAALDAAEVGVLTLIHLQCDYKTLLWAGGVPKVSSLLRVTPKQARRILERLEETGFIVRTTTPGHRGNYMIKLTTKACRDLGELWASIGPAQGEQGASTTESKQETLSQSSTNEGEQGASIGLASGEYSTRTNTRTRTQETPRRKERAAEPTMLTEFRDHAFQRFQDVFGTKPDWTAKDYVQLAALVKRQPNPAELRRRWEICLVSNFNPGSLAFFASHFDRYLKAETNGTYLLPEERRAEYRKKQDAEFERIWEAEHGKSG